MVNLTDTEPKDKHLFHKTRDVFLITLAAVMTLLAFSSQLPELVAWLTDKELTAASAYWTELTVNIFIAIGFCSPLFVAVYAAFARTDAQLVLAGAYCLVVMAGASVIQ